MKTYALTTKNDGRKIHFMSAMNFAQALQDPNPLFQHVMRVSKSIVTTDGNGNHYTMFKLDPNLIIYNTDGFITLKDPITRQIVRIKDKPLTIGPLNQNTNQRTIGSSLSDVKKKEIESQLQSQLQLQSQAEETKSVNIIQYIINIRI